MLDILKALKTHMQQIILPWTALVDAVILAVPVSWPVIPSFQDSDGDKSDDLVVDVSNEVRLQLNRAAQSHSLVWRLHTN